MAVGRAFDSFYSARRGIYRIDAAKHLVEIHSIREPDGDQPGGTVRGQVSNDAKIASRCTGSTNLPSGE